MTVLVLMWGKVGLKVNTVICNQLSHDAERFSWIQPTTLPLVQFTFRVVIVALQAYLILSAWKISLTSWRASAGVMGIAVGFAAKDTLANFIAWVSTLSSILEPNVADISQSSVRFKLMGVSGQRFTQQLVPTVNNFPRHNSLAGRFGMAQ